MNQVAQSNTLASNWKSLFRAGGAAALMVALLLPIEIVVFIAYPAPSTVEGYFTLLQSNKLLGLLDLYLVEVLAYALYIPMYLALYAALRRTHQSFMMLATTLAVMGIAVFLATNNPFSMLSLSDQYVGATTDAQRSQFLAAGQALLANTGQRAVGGFNMGLFLVSVGGLIGSVVMLKSDLFGKATAYAGILANALSLAEYVRMIFLPSAEYLLLFLAMSSGLLLLIWYFQIGRKLVQLAS